MEFMACATKTLHPNTDVLLTVVLVSPPYIYYIEVALVGHALACTYLNTYLGAVRHRAIAAAQHKPATSRQHTRVKPGDTDEHQSGLTGTVPRAASSGLSLLLAPALAGRFVTPPPR
jgi:hypothetical protein